MSDDCESCGALWRRNVLSVRDPDCPVCDTRVCAKCHQVRCEGCNALLHHGCAVLYGEDLYCPKCAAKEARIDLLASLSLEEKLVASVAVANYRKEMVA